MCVYLVRIQPHIWDESPGACEGIKNLCRPLPITIIIVILIVLPSNDPKLTIKSNPMAA
jgi:hypothetical protein